HAPRPSCCTDTESELDRDCRDAAADIQASHGLANANSPKERFRRRPFRTGEELQPLYRLVAASENVGVVFLKFAHFNSGTQVLADRCRRIRSMAREMVRVASGRHRSSRLLKCSGRAGSPAGLFLTFSGLILSINSFSMLATDPGV